MNKPTPQEIAQAFSPANEVDLPRLFSGRGEQLKAAMRHLNSQNGSFLIHGIPGVGKTSFAKQVRLIGMGNLELPERLGLLAEAPKSFFPSIYYPCNDFCKDIETLFERIGADTDPQFSLRQFFKVPADEIQTQEKNSSKVGFSYKGLAMSASDEAAITEVFKAKKSVDAFCDAAHRIYATTGAPLLVVLDEIDRIKDRKGLASLIKAWTHVRFMLVGVAQDFKALVDDHKSVERQLIEGTIRIDPMSDAELREILETGSRLSRIDFSPQAAGLIVDQSQGFPFYTHLFGKNSSFAAYDAGVLTVEVEHVEQARVQLVKENGAPALEERYQALIKGSPRKEVVLKAMAAAIAHEIATREIYRQCSGRGVRNASGIVAQLVKIGVLRRVRKNCYAFRDEQFKIFIRLRTWKFVADAPEWNPKAAAPGS